MDYFMQTTTPTFNYNKDIGTANILSKISTATGIDNLSNTSIIRLISQASAADVEFLVGNQQLTINQVFGATASGKFLDYKGSDHGISRNIIDSIIVFATDQAIKLEVDSDVDTFGGVLDTASLAIPANTMLANISNKYTITTIYDINLSPSSSSQYIDVVITPFDQTTVDSTTFSINTGDIIGLAYSNVISDLYNNCQLSTDKTIIIETQNEIDDDYRLRIQNARVQPTVGAVQGFAFLLDEIPQLLGYSIVSNQRNNHSVDFNIVTQSLIDGTNYSFVPAYVANLATNYFAYGTDLLVQFPSQLEIFIQYTTGNSESISNDAINSTIQTLFNSQFLYSQSNLIEFNVLEAAVKAALPQLSAFTVNELKGFDTNLQMYVLDVTNDVSVPLSYYCYINDVANLTNLAENG